MLKTLQLLNALAATKLWGVQQLAATYPSSLSSYCVVPSCLGHLPCALVCSAYFDLTNVA